MTIVVRVQHMVVIKKAGCCFKTDLLFSSCFCLELGMVEITVYRLKINTLK